MAAAYQGTPGAADHTLGLYTRRHAERTVRAEANPAVAMGCQYVRGQLELGRGRVADSAASPRG